MTVNKNQDIGAQVVLHSASGKAYDPSITITSENLSAFTPETKAVNAAIQVFQSRGFVVGPMVGISFSITAPWALFEEFFGMQIGLGSDGVHEFHLGQKNYGHELSGSDLPLEVRDMVQAVVFSLPPDFGPVSY